MSGIPGDGAMVTAWRSPLALPGLVALLGADSSRRELMSRLKRLADSDHAIVVGDPDDPSICLVIRPGVERPTIEVVLEGGARGPARTHPVASVLPDALPEQGMVDTVRWPSARLAYLSPDLRGPTLPRSAADDGLMEYLARIFSENGTSVREHTGRRYVEPGVGRTYLIDFLRFAGSPEYCDFSVSGAGRSPYCKDGYLLPGSVADGNMPSIRAWHRHQMAVRLAAAGVRVPRTVAIIDLLGREHRMSDGTKVPAALLVRGFRTVLRVKQLDPLANLMMSRSWWRSIQDDISPPVTQRSRLAGVTRVGCSCYVPSVMLGAWPGRRCDGASRCFQRRWQRVRDGSPRVLEFARARLSVEDGRDPATELMSTEEYSLHFAAIMGAQLARLRQLRVLHDYRVLRGPWQDSRSVVNSLGDTNVTLAGELADLDTAIAVDEAACEDTLLISRDERRNLAAQFDDLHAIEAGLASGICRTVALIAFDGAQRAADTAATAFWDAYKTGLGGRP
jgi:hypothetical protein